MLAAQADVEARLRRDLTDEEATWLAGVLEEASAEVIEFCGRDFAEFDPVPSTVRIVVSRIAARALVATTTDVGTDAYTNQAGPYQQVRSVSSDASSGGVWLSKGDKRKLRAYCILRGAFTLDTTP